MTDLHGKGSVHRLTVRAIVEETTEAKTFIFDVPGELAATFRYRSGQFLTLIAEIGGQAHRRCYSLCSAPGLDAHPAVTIKRVKNGIVSNWLNDRVKIGDQLQVLPPSGRFLLPETQIPLRLYAAGSGITPVFSLLRSALAHWQTPIVLFYANRDPGSTIFAAKLAELAKNEAGRFTLVAHFDDQQGFVSAAEIAKLPLDPSAAEHFICGPAPFMDLIELALKEKGAHPQRIHVERFLSPDNPADHAPAPSATAGAATAGRAARLTVTLDGKQHTIDCRPGETILGAARRAGLEPPSACEQGSCGSCLAKVTKGEARMRVNDILNAAEIKEGLTLTCQAEAMTDEISVEF